MKNNKKSILFVINDFNVGGAEVFVFRLGIALQQNYRVYITDISPKNANNDFKEKFISNGFQYISPVFSFSNFTDIFLWKCNALLSKLGIHHFYKSISVFFARNYWKRMLSNNKINVINSHLLGADTFVYDKIISATSDISWVITLHSSYNPLHFETKSNIEKQHIFEHASKLFNRANAIVGVAEENFKIFNYVTVNKTPRKIYLGYDANQRDNIKLNNFRDSFNFIMIGRAIPEKGWEIAFDAFEKLLIKAPKSRLLIVSPLNEYLTFFKDKYRHNDRFVFLGYQEFPSDFIKQSHIGLLPSYGESLPYTVIECLGHHVPVIVSNRGEMERMIEFETEKEAGIVLEDDSNGLPSVIDLYEKMLLLVNDGELYLTLKNNTEHAFYKFDIHTCVSQYETVFQEITHE